MRNIVLDTNCLLVALPRRSPYRKVWDAFLRGEYNLCVTIDILDEYEEILSEKTTPQIARNVIKTILERPNTKKHTVYYNFFAIQSDPDDNKFVDCAVVANADYIVSNDAHFKVLKQITFPRVDVINIDEFVSFF